VALGNSGNPEAVPALATALFDPEPLVRSHAAWALGRIGGEAASHALAAAGTQEKDLETLAEIRLAEQQALHG
jgi:epoxyqueuosine reductase